jgi:hypothetical protein
MSHPKNKYIALLPIAFIAMVLTLSGCSADPAQETSQTPAANGQSLVNIETTNERLSPDLLAEVGRDDLFQPQIELEDPGKTPQDATAQVPTGGVDSNTPQETPSLDPFENISLIGVVRISSKKGMAILQTEKEGPSQVVRLGDTFTLNDYPGVKLKLAKLSRDEVTLTSNSSLVGSNKSKTIKLEKLIGFRGKKKENKNADTKSSKQQPQTNTPPTATNNTATNQPAAEEDKTSLEVLKTSLSDQTELIKA